jgi:small ligand-binding sensory domain FIST
MSRRFAAAVSEHPLLTHAAGEVIGQVMDEVGAAPDLAVLFATSRTIGALDDVCDAVRSTLAPTTFLACTAVSIIGNGREVEEVPAISLFAGRTDGLQSVRLEAQRSGDGWAISGFPAGRPEGTLILMADPFTFPVDGLLQQLAVLAPDLAVVGGLASASSVPGGNRLYLDDAMSTTGAVGVIVPPGAAHTLVSQGCRPVGDPFIVTEAENNLLLGLGGRPAVERLQAMVADADDITRDLIQQGLHVGIVVNEQQLDFRRGDFLIRGVVGIDADRGAVAVGDTVELGQTVQFQVRDADTADEDLRELLAGRSAAGAMVFTCNGRGSHLFDVPDHDAALIHETLQAPVAGMFCAGEFGPIGARNHMHGFTASMVLFD